MGITVSVGVGMGVSVGICVGVGVSVGIRVAVKIGLGVFVGVGVGVGALTNICPTEQLMLNKTSAVIVKTIVFLLFIKYSQSKFVKQSASDELSYYINRKDNSKNKLLDLLHKSVIPEFSEGKYPVSRKKLWKLSNSDWGLFLGNDGTLARAGKRIAHR